jgi:hypothetical protein
MNFLNFSSHMYVPNPWDYDFYTINWGLIKTKHQFLELWVAEHGGAFMQYLLKSGIVYFIVDKDFTLSDAFQDAILVSDSPTEPYPESEPDTNS